MFDIKDLAQFSEPIKRVIECLEKGASALFTPVIYKRMEKAKMLIAREQSEQKAELALKEAMTQDFIDEIRSSRDKYELENIAAIYGGAITLLREFDSIQLPDISPSAEWSAHFFDCSKDCSDDDVRKLWSRILAEEIKDPGHYYKRTLSNLRLIERYEAEWFVDFCKYSMDDCYIPSFVLDEDMYPFNQYQSLVDCGFLNAERGSVELHRETTLKLKTGVIIIKAKREVFEIPVLTLTDSGMQICSLLDIDADPIFVDKLVDTINGSGAASATIMNPNYEEKATTMDSIKEYVS